MNQHDQTTLNSTEDLNRTYIAPEIVRQRQRTIESLDIKSGETILDIGCGTGFLTYEMALIVGNHGAVHAMDISAPMIDQTIERCAPLGNVEASIGNVCDIQSPDNVFDVITCTQVLLYVDDIQSALSEMYRVLKPGGRIAVLETDWRGVVMSGNYPELTHTILRAWDETVASPNLPPKLPTLLNKQGFLAVRSEAIPLLNTSFSSNSYSANILLWLSKNAYKNQKISKEEGKSWMDDLVSLGEDGAYFFCVNRFLFIGVKG